MSSHSYVINIPKEIIKKFGWKERQKLEISLDDKKLQLNIKDWEKNKK